jgi:hypothetical protein
MDDALRKNEVRGQGSPCLDPHPLFLIKGNTNPAPEIFYYYDDIFELIL